jgi:hypothetical protein
MPPPVLETHPFPKARVIFLSIPTFITERDDTIHAKCIENASNKEWPYLGQTMPNLIALKHSQERSTRTQTVDPWVNNLCQASRLERISSPTWGRKRCCDQTISMPADILCVFLPNGLVPISRTLVARSFSVEELFNALLLFQAIGDEIEGSAILSGLKARALALQFFGDCLALWRAEMFYLQILFQPGDVPSQSV